jgi:uncharacterized membrane protein
MADINPYQAPQATVHDPVSTDGALAAEPLSVDAGRGIAWLTQGWSTFRQAPLIWIALTVIGIVLFVVLSFVPVLGQIGTSLLYVLFAGGIMLGCRALERGEELTIAHLFAGTQSHLSPLLVVGALYLAALFGLFLIVGLVGGGSIFAVVSGQIEAGAAVGSVLLTTLVLALLLVPLAMTVWFAPSLVALHNVAPVEAMKLSFRGCLRNLLAFLVYGVVLFILAIVASIPFGLGWLVLLPMTAGSVYASYKDIFLQH